MLHLEPINLSGVFCVLVEKVFWCDIKVIIVLISFTYYKKKVFFFFLMRKLFVNVFTFLSNNEKGKIKWISK
jgi:hypothetical protein